MERALIAAPVSFPNVLAHMIVEYAHAPLFHAWTKLDALAAPLHLYEPIQAYQPAAFNSSAMSELQCTLEKLDALEQVIATKHALPGFQFPLELKLLYSIGPSGPFWPSIERLSEIVHLMDAKDSLNFSIHKPGPPLRYDLLSGCVYGMVNMGRKVEAPSLLHLIQRLQTVVMECATSSACWSVQLFAACNSHVTNKVNPSLELRLRSIQSQLKQIPSIMKPELTDELERSWSIKARLEARAAVEAATYSGKKH